ncbi:MAG: serine hydrolase [Planctomycetota bacterium]|jgi:hypothetical protein
MHALNRIAAGLPLLALAGCQLLAGGPLYVGPPPDLDTLLSDADPRLKAVLDERETYRVQIAIAEVVPDGSGSFGLRRGFLGDPNVYFYPASSIKTAGAVAGLLELNALNAERGTAFGLDTELAYRALLDDEVDEDTDPSHLDGGRITVGHELRKLSIVSDNRAYNRFYELVGQDRLDAWMAAAGFPGFHLVHRLSEFRSAEDNRRFPRVELSGPRAGEQFAFDERTSAALPQPPEIPGLDAGRAHLAGGERIEQPLDFRPKNRVPLVELQDFLVELVRPEVDTGRLGFPNLTTEQRAFLLEAMAELPPDSADPVYDPERYPDDFVKFLLPGLREVRDDGRWRIYNKVGLAYGFTVENAYVEDRTTGRGLFVAATLYTNPNEVLNDGVYGYDELAFPFYAGLGKVVGEWLVGDD